MGDYASDRIAVAFAVLSDAVMVIVPTCVVASPSCLPGLMVLLARIPSSTPVTRLRRTTFSSAGPLPCARSYHPAAQLIVTLPLHLLSRKAAPMSTVAVSLPPLP